MGLSQSAATYITDEQDMTNLEEFRILTDSEVESLCKVIRRPGGTIANPNAGGNNNPTIPNPGITVSLKAENNLKLMCYYLRYKDRASTPVDFQDITEANVRSLRDYRQWENDHEDPSAPTLTFKDWPRTIDAIE